MAKVRNITVAVSPDLYRQTRHIAAESDTSVTELVRHILINLPELLRRTNHPAANACAASGSPSDPAAPAALAIPPSRRAASASQPAASPFPSASSPAIRPATVRRRAAVLREVQRLLNV